MADNRGGYRRPENPAPVSGPGKLSQRTDGFGQPNRQAPKKITGLPYGENKEANANAQGAPLAAAQKPITSLPPLNAPTAYPNQPITAGVPAGPGSNAVVAPGQREDDMVAAAIRAAYAATPSPQLRSLVNQLEIEGR